MVKGFNIAVLRVISGTDIGYNGFRSYILRIYHTSQVKAVYHFLKINLVNLGNYLGA